MGIFSHAMTAAQAISNKSASPPVNAAATSGPNGSDGSSDTSSNSATVSANDFLTLLVTEMKNQDPTADTDPNEYINQLVQVNSLEQLININQTLTTGLGVAPATDGDSGMIPQAASSNSSDGQSGAVASTTATHQVSVPVAMQPGKSASGAQQAQGDARHAPGNLSVPQVNHAAQRVGHALAGRTRAQPAS
jgi:flagellar basal-body rod modification protein FlgD